jgi:hypothetical protein
MIGKEYLGDEKTKRILSGEPFWCCVGLINSDGLQIIPPRKAKINIDWHNSLIEKDLEHYQYMLYGFPIKNVSVFDSEQDCREKFMTMLGVLEYKTVKICYQKIDELIQVKKKDVEEIRKHINKNVCERKKQQSLKYLLEEAKEQIDSQDSFIAFIEMFDKSLADKIRKAQEQVND